MYKTSNDGSLRFYIDHRNQDTITICDSYQLPKLKKYIKYRCHARTFPLLGTSTAYKQVATENSHRKEASTVQHSPYEIAQI